jgi:hypothetical protein
VRFHLECQLGDAATPSKTFNVEAISLAIGAMAGQHEPLECVVLNACCTGNMGRLLRQRGVPNMVCCRHKCGTRRLGNGGSAFFDPSSRSLKQADKQNCQRAFFAATDDMRSSARPVHQPLLEDGVSTAEQDEHSGSRPTRVRAWNRVTRHCVALGGAGCCAIPQLRWRQRAHLSVA